MKRKLGEDSPLLKYMIPSFAVGCRRPTPGNGYLESLTKENVRVVTDSISEIVPEGIKLTTGEVISIDIFICATGFDISFRPRYPVIGLNGITLAEQWKQKPEGYLSVTVPNFPNHFSKGSDPRDSAKLTGCSVPWSRGPNWTWVGPSYYRTCDQIYPPHDSQMSDSGRQVGRRLARSCRRLQRAYSGLHETNGLEHPLPILVQERHD